MSGKGSKQRPTDPAAYAANYERTFAKPEPPPDTPEPPPTPPDLRTP